MEIFKESDLDGFKNNKIAVHCRTEESSKKFLEWCYKKNVKFISGSVTDGFWDIFKEETCYNFEDGYLLFSDKPYYLEEGHIVKEFKEFKGFENPEDEDTFVFECEVPIYENGMPTLLEYFMQIHELEEGEEFTVNGHGRYRIIDNETEILEYDNKWRRSFVSATDLNMLKISKAEWKPTQGDEYYYINLYSDIAIAKSYWTNFERENVLFERGLIFRTKEEAEKRYEQILDLNKQ